MTVPDTPVGEDRDAVADRLVARIKELESALWDVADFAHARSTGPAVPDDLWEVRRMASAPLFPPAPEVPRA